MAFLDYTLYSPRPSSIERLQFITRLWSGSDHRADAGDKSWELDENACCEYHRKQCIEATHEEDHISAKTHGDIAKIVDQISQGLSREQIMVLLDSTVSVGHLERVTEREMQLNNSIDLAARLASMMDIGPGCCGFSGRNPLIWAQGSLKDFINSHFSQPIQLRHDVKLGKVFNGRNLERIAGIRMEWTSNMVDHLRVFDHDEKRVAIFHHASFLKCQQNTLYPPGLLEETIRTLALLFPESDKDIVKWYRKHRAKLPCLDDQLIKCGRLSPDDRNVEKFKFWHDRIVILKEVFDESRPGTISQWWCDRRNGVQWYTFWVAIIVLFLTIFFGIVQTIEGALQVYKAYYPTKLNPVQQT